MTGSQKVLKVFSIIAIMLAVLGFVSSALLIAGSGLAEVQSLSVEIEGVVVDGGTAFIIAVIPGIVSGICNLIVGIAGLRGANHPEKIGFFWGLCILGIVANVAMAIFMLAGGTFDYAVFVNLAIVIICFILANNVKKLAR